LQIIETAGHHDLFKDLKLIKDSPLWNLRESLEDHPYGDSNQSTPITKAKKKGLDNQIRLKYEYLGQVNGKTAIRDGFGKCIYDNKIMYEGSWAGGVFSGRGRLLDIRNAKRQITLDGVWYNKSTNFKGGITVQGQIFDHQIDIRFHL
jgi:hypothetical protein